MEQSDGKVFLMRRLTPEVLFASDFWLGVGGHFGVHPACGHGSKVEAPGIGPQVLVLVSIYQGNPFWVLSLSN